MPSLSIERRLPSTLLRQLNSVPVGLTFVTLGELTRWATMRQWGPRGTTTDKLDLSASQAQDRVRQQRVTSSCRSDQVPSSGNPAGGSNLRNAVRSADHGEHGRGANWEQHHALTEPKRTPTDLNEPALTCRMLFTQVRAGHRP
jgi:hypothetical protein